MTEIEAMGKRVVHGYPVTQHSIQMYLTTSYKKKHDEGAMTVIRESMTWASYSNSRWALVKIDQNCFIGLSWFIPLHKISN